MIYSRESAYILLRKFLDRFDRTDLERALRVEIVDDLFYSRFIISHLDERGDECHVGSVFLFRVRSRVLREIDRTLEVHDDLLSCLLADPRDRRDQLIIFELDRLEKSISPKTKEIQCSFSSDSIHLEKLTKEIFFATIDKSK